MQKDFSPKDNSTNTDDLTRRTIEHRDRGYQLTELNEAGGVPDAVKHLQQAIHDRNQKEQSSR